MAHGQSLALRALQPGAGKWVVNLPRTRGGNRAKLIEATEKLVAKHGGKSYELYGVADECEKRQIAGLLKAGFRARRRAWHAGAGRIVAGAFAGLKVLHG